ncbi:hypothetical protein BGW36DRAFT_392128 [Talaromyces proteolyticus]|uniref:Uncharacterized protein n=1 Tax=Talaromyces proteolyticus TaxID=1131652 RepID=A0AAD4KD94_9EURO|nr:uncharacterized protein BGW36DRAFT_392128 [Talaromyces proteolyticus]KAH8688760.1 hypothetical protein BGW36DRAFT_392128 [Talaromyces proteolyticus]
MEACNTSNPVAIDFPLHPSNVGKLLQLIDTLGNVESLVISHINKQESQERENIELLFSENKHLLTDDSSPWNSFTHNDINFRLRFLRNLLETIRQHQETFARLKRTFTFEWRKEPRCQISEEGRTYLANIQSIWEKMEEALSVVAPNIGPYPLFLDSECERYMELLRSAVRKISNGGILRLDHYRWIELDMSKPLPSISQQPEESTTQGRPSSLDLESGGPGDQPFWEKWRWLLVKEIQLIAVCLLVAILYSALKNDPQTGFQIAAFLFAIGTTFLAIFRMYFEQRENKEAKIRLQ